MDAPDKKHVLLLITNRYAATNVIHSGLIGQLARQYEVALLSDIIDADMTAIINTHFNIKIHPIELRIKAETSHLKLLRRLEKWVYMKHFQIETQQIKNKELPLFYSAVIGLFSYFLSIQPLSLSLLRHLRRYIIRNTSKHTCNATHYDGVISTSPLDIRENSIVNQLSTRNVRSMAIIISWDNLTSKGVMNADHDYVLVWNKIMSEEYRHFYSVLSQKPVEVKIVGIPRFDVYRRSKDARSNQDQCPNISASNKIILFATSASKHFPDQADIVAHLVEYIKLRDCFTLQVRCHPADDSLAYQKYKDEKNVKISTSSSMTKTPSIPDLRDLDSLAYVLKSCSVCVQVASTIRLEAALCNKPIISIAYDGNSNVPEHLSVKRFYGYSHQLALNALDIDQLVYSKDELFRYLDKFLDGKQEIDNQKKLQHFIPFTEFSATQTTLNSIRQWLS
jgi:hypothetical protein